jgi:plastocyanin
MIRGAVLVLLAALVLAVPAADGMPRQTKKQCLKAAKHHRSKAKRRKARKRCLRRYRHRKPAAAPVAPAAPPTPTAPGAATAPATPDEPGGPALPDDPADNPRAVQVTSGEYFLKLSKHEVLSGDVRVEFNNTLAEDPHDLKLSHGEDLYGFDELPAGQVRAQTFHLTAGTWQLFCALPEHASRGMTATLKVTG